MAANMQYMIRQNAQKMQDTMSDLYDWCVCHTAPRLLPLRSRPMTGSTAAARSPRCTCARLTLSRENDINEKDAKLGGAGTGKAGKGQVRTVSGGVRAAPVRATAATGARKGLNVPAPRSAAETPAEAGGDLITQMGNVQKRHAERELQIAKEEKEREEASKKKEDWKSGNMGDFYKKWDKFDESDAPDAEEEAPSNAQKAAPKVNQKLGPGGIGLPEPVDAADIPAASQMPRGLGENITALDDPTLNGGAREKDKGNSLYQDKRFGEAVAAYTRGLDVLYGKAAAECTVRVCSPLAHFCAHFCAHSLLSSFALVLLTFCSQATEQLQALKATLYCNRAMAHLKLENWELADADASSSLDLDPAMVKAYLRRGAARREQHRYADAVQDFERVLQIDPTNKDGIKQLGKAVQLVSKFGKAAKRGASAGGPAKGFFGASSAKADRSSGGAGGKKGKDKGLVFAFEGSKKQKARAEEKPWRVKIPIREVDGFVSAFVDDDLGAMLLTFAALWPQFRLGLRLIFGAKRLSRRG